MKKFLKYSLALTIALLAGVACDKTTEEVSYDPSTAKKVIIKPSNSLLAADGADVLTLSVLADDYDVTHLATFYLKKDGDFIPMDGNEFSTKIPAKYTFWATVEGVKQEMIKPIEVEAIIFDTPDAPGDPQSGSTSFVQRTLITKYTGTGCPNCPNLIQGIEFLEKDNAYKDKFVLGACYTYPSTTIRTTSTNLATNFNVLNYPAVMIGFKYSTSGQNASYFYTFMQQAIDDLLSDPAEAGIAVNSEFVEGADILMATVEVKAAADGDYYLGCWLVEDKVMAVQSGAGDTPIEHNAIIRVDANYEKNRPVSYMGSKELPSMKAGNKQQHTYKINLDPSWVKANCRLVLYVTHKQPNGAYHVTNAISAPAGTSKPYEYK